MSSLEICARSSAWGEDCSCQTAYQTVPASLRIPFVLVFRHSPSFTGLSRCPAKFIPRRQNPGGFAGHKIFLLMRTDSSDYCSVVQVERKGA